MKIKHKTPICLDLIGGVTSDPIYSKNNDSIVLCSAIDIYSIANIKSNNKITFESSDRNYKLSFNNVEEIKLLKKENSRLLNIPYVRLHIASLLFLLEKFNINIKNFHITTLNQLPFNSGLGGSSSLIISILKCYFDFFEMKYNKELLASLSYLIKKDFLKDYCSFANNYGCAYSSFSLIKKVDNEIIIRPYILNENKDLLKSLKDSLSLIYCKSESKEYIKSAKNKNQIDNMLIAELHKKAEEAIVKTQRKKDVGYLIDALDNYWILKNRVYNSYSEHQKDTFLKLLELGFTGGKICGFYSNYFLMVSQEESKQSIIKKLPQNFEVLNFNFLT